VAGSCEYCDEPSGSGATELVIVGRVTGFPSHCREPEIVSRTVTTLKDKQVILREVRVEVRSRGPCPCHVACRVTLDDGSCVTARSRY
jgi:hypothetical protein